ncbi:phosphoserine phosphatase SerB [Rarobacter incanus]|uniref:phosphoserine phosphatase n=1 Tax=Rarobacter incanus TaxID=153494 RepID=A0A542SMC6_9MICO|nr:phosphoserine phosphatase SerB [Rarobacter incanus]TQK75782.1 phosphoserine phosphatase [Rarobacter incanus]
MNDDRTAPSPTLPTRRHRLVVMDVDSTLINEEVIELLARRAGSEPEVARITARAMNGEIDFAESLRERVATLRGLPSSVFAQVRAEATLTPGAREFIDECHARGWTVALVSGGFREVVVPLAAPLGITEVRANALEVSGDCLTGRTIGRIIDAQAKEDSLREFAAAAGIAMRDTIAIGDGANDLRMIAAAGVGIAFCAKPRVNDVVRHKVTERDLRLALRVIDDLD